MQMTQQGELQALCCASALPSGLSWACCLPHPPAERQTRLRVLLSWVTDKGSFTLDNFYRSHIHAIVIELGETAAQA